MDQTSPPPISPRPQGNWWSRNWKWFVPLGCFTMFAFVAVFVACIIGIVFSAMKSTDVYKDALARAREYPAVVEALGSPIKDGFFISGNTNVNGTSGESNLSVPLSGPKGKGTLYLKAEKSMGRWKYSALEVEVEKTKERIDLLVEPESSNRL